MTCEKRHDRGASDSWLPAAFCSVCQQRILKAVDGNAYWRPEFDAGEDAFYAAGWPVVFAHKSCNASVDPLACWMPLDKFFLVLIAGEVA